MLSCEMARVPTSVELNCCNQGCVIIVFDIAQQSVEWTRPLLFKENLLSFLAPAGKETLQTPLQV